MAGEQLASLSATLCRSEEVTVPTHSRILQMFEQITFLIAHHTRLFICQYFRNEACCCLLVTLGEVTSVV